MHYLIDTITGRPEEAQDLESIQEAIDQLNEALHEAFELRDKLKEDKPCPHDTIRTDDTNPSASFCKACGERVSTP